ncbi:MAG: toll/interleukin-1 receptor domain-containing protein, partial [Elainellaceae cyanobacterium]
YKELIPCNCSSCRGNANPESYPYDLLQKYLRDRRYSIECRSSYEDVDVRRLMDEVVQNYASVEESYKVQHSGFGHFNRDRAHGGQLAPIDHVEKYSDVANKEIFISYAWEGGEAIANKVEAICQQRNIPLRRDSSAIDYKGPIRDFMQRLGRGKAVILVVSDAYLKSESCMFELLEISKNSAGNEDFRDRIFTIVLPDARGIYKPRPRLQYIKHWEAEINALNEDLKDVDPANLQGFREEIDLYSEIRGAIAGLISTLKDMNTFNIDAHQDSDFEALIAAIEKQLE